MHRPSCLDAACEALRLADASPAEAVALASATVRRARRQGDATAGPSRSGPGDRPCGTAATWTAH